MPHCGRLGDSWIAKRTRHRDADNQSCTSAADERTERDRGIASAVDGHPNGLRRKGQTGAIDFPRDLISCPDFPRILWLRSLDPLTENQLARPVVWKRLILLVGRGGLEPPTD